MDLKGAEDDECPDMNILRWDMESCSVTSSSVFSDSILSNSSSTRTIDDHTTITENWITTDSECKPSYYFFYLFFNIRHTYAYIYMCFIKRVSLIYMVLVCY